MNRKLFQQKVYDAVEGIDDVKEVVQAYVPPPSKIKRFPAVAIDFPNTDLKRGVGKGFNVTDTVHLFVYTKSRVTNKYDDSINELLETIFNAIVTDTTLNQDILDIYPTNIKTDGGMSYPIIVNRMELKASYQTDCI